MLGAAVGAQLGLDTQDPQGLHLGVGLGGVAELAQQPQILVSRWPLPARRPGRR
jgi:hypothetical protein